MNPRIFTALIVFFGSYLPLSVILLVLNFDASAVTPNICLNLLDSDCRLPLKTPNIAIGIFLLCTTCFLISVYILRLIRSGDHPIVIVESKHMPAELMSYVLPYVVSFMTIDYQDTSKLFGILIFLLWMFWITYKSEQIIMNPMLTVLGWKLYDVRYKHQGDLQDYHGKLLSKLEVQPNQNLDIGRFQGIIIVKQSG